MTVAILASCVAQALRPRLVAAIQQTGERLGLDLVAPTAQTCCGLPAWEAGRLSAARAAARHTLSVFAPFESVVTPSPACLRMVRHHIPTVLEGAPEAAAAQSLAARSQTWCDYLAQTIAPDRLNLRFDGTVALFLPCTDAGDAAGRLLARCQGTRVLPVSAGRCCGWGGNLALRHPEMSRSIAGAVITDLVVARANLVLTTDVGCLVHLAPLIQASGGPPMLHIAEFLALASAEGR